jgi:hypothetical protein
LIFISAHLLNYFHVSLRFSGDLFLFITEPKPGIGVVLTLELTFPLETVFPEGRTTLILDKVVVAAGIATDVLPTPV